MPELPEVETIRTELLPKLGGKCFTEVTVFDTKILRQPSVEEFCERLVSQKIQDIQRRGKYLIFRLSNGESLVIHLKMAGALLLTLNQPVRYLRASFRFEDDTKLFLIDRRRFAKMWLTKNAEDIIHKLGPEPLTQDFSYKVFLSRLKGRKAPIKTVLIDQKFIAGMGNMYADEALFSAKVHPLRPADSLSPKEGKRLYKAIREVLQSAIGNKGASVDTYIRPDGSLGTAHFNFRVAHQRGKVCPVCGSSIQRIPLRNRGTYFCPKCQV